MFTVSFVNFSCGCQGKALITAWNGGMLLTKMTNCQKTTFQFFNSSTGAVASSSLPSLSASLNSLITGANNDLWGATTQQLYYYSAAHNRWASVPLTNYSYNYVTSIEWDSANNYLLVYLSVKTYSGTRHSGILCKVTTEAFPPIGVTELIASQLAVYGTVNAVATSPQQKSNDYGSTFATLSLSFHIPQLIPSFRHIYCR